MSTRLHSLTLALAMFGLASSTQNSTGAAALAAAAQAKVDAITKEAQTWACDAALVSAVKAQNASVPANYAAMNEEKWKSLLITDPLVRSLSKNAAGQFLKTKKTDINNKIFVSDAAGLKVAFLDKTANWCHKGQPKHEVPMTGKTWQGAVGPDPSTGLESVQVSVPVLDGGKPIGSVVLSLVISQLPQ